MSSLQGTPNSNMDESFLKDYFIINSMLGEDGVYVHRSACTLKGQKRALDPWSQRCRQLWATQSGFLEPSMGPDTGNQILAIGGGVSGLIFSQGQSSNPGFTYASVPLLSCIPQTYLLIGNAINGTESKRWQMLVRTWAACLTPLLEPPGPLFKAKLCYTSMNILPKTSCAFIIHTKNFTNTYLYASML